MTQSERILDLFDLPKSLTREEWLTEAQGIAKRIAMERGEVTADDIHDALPIPNGVERRTMGRVFAGLRCVGYGKSRRNECHRRPIGRFAL